MPACVCARLGPARLTQIPIDSIFGTAARAAGVARLNIEGQHRGAVAAAKQAAEAEHKHDHDDHKHSHEGHEHHDDCKVNAGTGRFWAGVVHVPRRVWTRPIRRSAAPSQPGVGAAHP